VMMRRSSSAQAKQVIQRPCGCTAWMQSPTTAERVRIPLSPWPRQPRNPAWRPLCNIQALPCRFQMRNERSSDTVAKRCPSSEKRSSLMGWECAADKPNGLPPLSAQVCGSYACHPWASLPNDRTHWPPSTSHCRTVPSLPAETIKLQSGWNCTLMIRPSWPRMTWAQVLVVGFHSRTLQSGSKEQDPIHRPSGDQSTSSTQSVWPCRTCNGCGSFSAKTRTRPSPLPVQI
jgi:hypothetical protein